MANWGEAVWSRNSSLGNANGGLGARGRMEVRAADAAAVIAGDPRPVLGRGTLRVEVEGAGLSPAAFIGSLEGKGTIAARRRADRRASMPGRSRKSSKRSIAGSRSTPESATSPSPRSTSAASTCRTPKARSPFPMDALASVWRRRRNGRIWRFRAVSISPMEGSICGSRSPVRQSRQRLRAPRSLCCSRGPVATPRRTVDIAALANWLTLRAVEQQAKHLEAIEVERRERDSAPEATPPAVAPARAVPESPAAGAKRADPGAAGAISPRCQALRSVRLSRRARSGVEP